MKKILLLIPALIIALAGCKENADATQTNNEQVSIQKTDVAQANSEQVSIPKADVAQFEKYIKEIEGANSKVAVEKLADIDEMPGFAYVRLMVERDGQTPEKNIITNGRLLIDAEIIDLKDRKSLTSRLEFNYAKPKDIDVSGLTLAGGKKDGKTVIVEITDFQCPYCKEANKLFKQKLKNKNDYALYIIHMPLDMHPNARIMAQIFEAGMKMGKNFKNDLFEFDAEKLIDSTAKKYKEDKNNAGENTEQFTQEDVNKIFKLVDEAIVEKFANKTSNPEKFKSLVYSTEIVDIVNASIKKAEELGERSTPAFYINGKNIQGYNAPLLNQVLDEVK